jgi:dienelactone hydrolase
MRVTRILLAAASITAVRAYAARLPAANGKVGTMGFCKQAWPRAVQFLRARLR